MAPRLRVMSSTAVLQMPQKEKVNGNIEKRKSFCFFFIDGEMHWTKDALDAGIICIIEHLLALIICMRCPEPIFFIVGGPSYPNIVLVL